MARLPGAIDARDVGFQAVLPPFIQSLSNTARIFDIGSPASIPTIPLNLEERINRGANGLGFQITQRSIFTGSAPEITLTVTNNANPDVLALYAGQDYTDGAGFQEINHRFLLPSSGNTVDLTPLASSVGEGLLADPQSFVVDPFTVQVYEIPIDGTAPIDLTANLETSVGFDPTLVGKRYAIGANLELLFSDELQACAVFVHARIPNVTKRRRSGNFLGQLLFSLPILLDNDDILYVNMERCQAIPQGILGGDAETIDLIFRPAASALETCSDGIDVYFETQDAFNACSI